MTPDWSLESQMMGLVSSGPFPEGQWRPRPALEVPELQGRKRHSWEGLTSSPEEEASGPRSLSLKKPFHPEAQEEVALRSKPGPCPSRKQKRPGDMAMVEGV